MEFIKTNIVVILMMTPLLLNIIYLGYLIVKREYFERDREA